MLEAEKFYKKVGVKIKKLRLEKKMKQIELAYDCDFKKQTMAKIEAGKMNLTLKTLIKLSEALNTTPSNILDV